MTAPPSQFLILNMAVWTMGLAAAIAWFLRGIETSKGVSIVVTSGEQ